MGVDKEILCHLFRPSTREGKLLLDDAGQVRHTSAMARPSFSRQEARTGMWGAGPAGWAGHHTRNLPLSHGRYAA
jgi:hypothetical protein